MRNEFKRMMKQGKQGFGTWITVESPMCSELMSSFGFDYFVFDNEHSPLDMLHIQTLMQAMRGDSKTTPIVRPWWNDMVAIKRALDIGAQGILAPWINNEEQAKAVVSYTRYPSKGLRGCGLRRAYLEYGIGGGIVWDSTSPDEYAEALLKARILTEASPSFSLLETLLWTPEDGFHLQSRHMDRLLDSATYFGFPVSRAAIGENLQRIATKLDQPHRVRLLLDREGKMEVTCAPIFFDTKPVHAALAKGPVSSNDLFLFHKTTRREVYDQALKGHPGCDDVLLHNERGELTEFSIGTTTFPLILPFLFVGDGHRALRLSNAVAVVMLLLAGYQLGKYAGTRPIRLGLIMVAAGIVLVGLTIALGG